MSVVHSFKSAHLSASSAIGKCKNRSRSIKICYPALLGHLQIPCASRYTATLLKTVGGITVLALAKHKVLVSILAVLADEEACRLERCRGDTELVNVWLAGWHGSRVDVGLRWELCISVCGHFETLCDYLRRVEILESVCRMKIEDVGIAVRFVECHDRLQGVQRRCVESRDGVETARVKQSAKDSIQDSDHGPIRAKAFRIRNFSIVHTRG